MNGSETIVPHLITELYSKKYAPRYSPLLQVLIFGFHYLQFFILQLVRENRTVSIKPLKHRTI